MNIKNVLLGSNAGMETFAPLINAVVNNALFHSNSRINQILPQIIHILRFFLVDSLPRI